MYKNKYAYILLCVIITMQLKNSVGNISDSNNIALQLTEGVDSFMLHS